MNNGDSILLSNRACEILIMICVYKHHPLDRHNKTSVFRIHISHEKEHKQTLSRRQLFLLIYFYMKLTKNTSLNIFIRYK